MLLLCSPLISEQVFFLYINPTCVCTHTHTLSFSPCIFLFVEYEIAAMQMGQRLEPLLKWNKIQQRLFHIGCAYKVNILSFSGAKCSIVQQSGTKFTSNTEIMTGCLHTLLGLNQNLVPLPTIQQVSFHIALLGLNHIRLVHSKGPKAWTRAVQIHFASYLPQKVYSTLKVHIS